MTAAVARLPPLTLVLGGARSGKSRYAEALIDGRSAIPIYIATGAPRDAEMAERIRRHRLRRGARWRTVEVPIALLEALRTHARADAAVLVDCLTLWLSNLLDADRDVEAEIAAFLAGLAELCGPVVFVSNEVGLGIVPDNALARRFRDLAGRLHEGVADAAQAVAFMVAGQPIHIKTSGSAG
jgi:adenosylcobinamide kinase/adenosylcobinamide-phosphate guanylyltransferase